MDFKWEMQERIDGGMNPDAAYEATRDSYAGAYDNRDKFASIDRASEYCGDDLDVCSCYCDADCECKAREDSVEGLYTGWEIIDG